MCIVSVTYHCHKHKQHYVIIVWYVQCGIVKPNTQSKQRQKQHDIYSVFCCATQYGVCMVVTWCVCQQQCVQIEIIQIVMVIETHQIETLSIQTSLATSHNNSVCVIVCSCVAYKCNVCVWWVCEGKYGICLVCYSFEINIVQLNKCCMSVCVVMWQLTTKKKHQMLYVYNKMCMKPCINNNVAILEDENVCIW